jgi:hypothetical protein
MQITPGGSNHFKKSDNAVCYMEVYEPLCAAEASAQDAPAPAGGAAKPAAPATGVTIEIRLLDAKTGDQKRPIPAQWRSASMPSRATLLSRWHSVCR